MTGRASFRISNGLRLYGYFPGYLTSNLMAAQFAAALERELGPLRHLLAAGRFREIHQWLATRIHRFGAIYPPGELVKRATGGTPPLHLLHQLSSGRSILRYTS